MFETLGGILNTSDAIYSEGMNTIHLTDAELELARHALQAYLRAFGHREADTVAEIKKVVAKFGAPEPEGPKGEEPRYIA